MFDFALSRVAAAGSMLHTSGLHLPFHRGFCSWLKAGVVDDDRIVMRGVQSLCYDRISELEGKEDVKIPPKSFLNTETYRTARLVLASLPVTIRSQNAAVHIVKGFFSEQACTREGCEELLPHLPSSKPSKPEPPKAPGTILVH
jgi:hypothetical protein